MYRLGEIYASLITVYTTDQFANYVLNSPTEEQYDTLYAAANMAYCARAHML